MIKYAKILASIVGGWLSLMSGAISVPIALVAIYIHGTAGFWLAVTAFAALWFIVIRTSWKNYQLIKIRPLEITPLEPNYVLTIESVTHYVGESPTVNGIATSAAECNIEIRNRNQGTDNVVFRILELEPPMRAVFNSVSTVNYNLRGLIFPFKDIAGLFLNDNQTGHIHLFTAYRSMEGIDLSFGGDWNDHRHNRFEPQKDHIFTIELSANGVPAKQHKFKATFSRDPTTPLFAFKELTTA